jgi:GDP-D-mannose 3',5'-epimerase
MKPLNCVILGAGGFIGSHLAQRLVKQGNKVRGVDLKYPKYLPYNNYEFIIGDLRDPSVANVVIPPDCDEVYNLACLMGGAGYIFTGNNDADIFSSSALINLNVANSCIKKNVKKLFFSSSACIYSQDWQTNEVNNPLKEYMDYPANPDSDYGWLKLMSERLFQAYNRNYGLNIRIARFHNIYGMGLFYGGKEKAPAATVRKVIMAKDKVEVWGSGKQVRSFLYIDDCLDAVELLMKSDHIEPINIGSEQFISINDLTQMVINIAGLDLRIENIPGPVGVAGRSSDNTKIKEVLGWEPKIHLQEGMERLFEWVAEEMKRMPFIYEKNDRTGEIRQFISEKNDNGELVNIYF